MISNPILRTKEIGGGIRSLPRLFAVWFYDNGILSQF
jgi:hypothetical protein